jgi:uncharacterized membrane protein
VLIRIGPVVLLQRRVQDATCTATVLYRQLHGPFGSCKPEWSATAAARQQQQWSGGGSGNGSESGGGGDDEIQITLSNKRLVFC